MLLLMVIVGISKFLMSVGAYGDKTNQPSFHLCYILWFSSLESLSIMK